MYFLYNILLNIITLLLIPYYTYNGLRSGQELGLKERFAFYRDDLKLIFPADRVIWIHAASAGETLAAKEFTDGIRKKYPSSRIIFSNMTPTGRKIARKKIDSADCYIYLPLDLKWIVRRAVKFFSPDLFVLIETELWPNLIKELDSTNCSIMLASGRISDDTFNKYKYMSAIMEDMLHRIDIISMQNREGYDKIIELGAPEDHVCINGNLKYDIYVDNLSRDELEKKKELFNLKDDTPVLTAGSTHKGEEEKILEVYKKLKNDFSNLKLFLAPRYVERREELQSLCGEYNFNSVLYTKLKKGFYEGNNSADIIIVDTMGELSDLYHFADIIFVGGSLIKRGGHNVIEAAARSKVVLFGPSMYNFKEERDFLLENNIGFKVKNKEELYQKIYELLLNRDEMEYIGQNAGKILAENRGAVDKHLQLTEFLLKKGVD
ncbi:3-deoxy-D-manno-octulosonic-acid transferase [Halanaerobium sp. DL-01]|uniref:3-deoxy-D-manno-octulosonic acid transferase n=1 Tax=Halanaerobium sp. DL-01 TaxID=1653064 RepID=UPI000DF46F15|nr:3-deoxy-D-manno-octulosonic acid transferase [Halanaerobium sp. DL-01]RCW83297.1 3-deoxy-D-manno-octulosonic-acid transferase [Halanaerobium sp. DL-01]